MGEEQENENCNENQPWPKNTIFGQDLDKIALDEKKRQVKELYVVIETLQNNLSAATSYLNDEQMDAVDNHSFRWCSGWRPGDEAS
jgi:hypothetical protein